MSEREGYEQQPPQDDFEQFAETMRVGINTLNSRLGQALSSQNYDVDPGDFARELGQLQLEIEDQEAALMSVLPQEADQKGARIDQLQRGYEVAERRLERYRGEHQAAKRAEIIVDKTKGLDEEKEELVNAMAALRVALGDPAFDPRHKYPQFDSRTDAFQFLDIEMTPVVQEFKRLEDGSKAEKLEALTFKDDYIEPAQKLREALDQRIKDLAAEKDAEAEVRFQNWETNQAQKLKALAAKLTQIDALPASQLNGSVDVLSHITTLSTSHKEAEQEVAASSYKDNKAAHFETNYWHKANEALTVLQVAQFNYDIRTLRQKIERVLVEDDHALETKTEAELTMLQTNLKSERDNVAGDDLLSIATHEKSRPELTAQARDQLRKPIGDLKDAHHKQLERVANALERKKAVDAFEQQTQALRNAINNIPRRREDLGIPKFRDQYAELEKRKDELEEQNELAEQTGLLREKTGKSESERNIANAINAQIRELIRIYGDAIQRVERLMREADQPSIEVMSLEDLADECLAKGWDPFMWTEQKFQQEGRMKDVIQAIKDIIFGKEEIDFDAEMDRVVQKVKLQLVTLDNKGIHETGKASIHRGLLWNKEQGELRNRQVQRRELLMVVNHQVWGKQVTEILDRIIWTAALDNGEQLVERNGQKVHLLVGETRQGGDRELAVHDEDLNYNALAGERGRLLLAEGIDKLFPHAHEEAKSFASLMFTTFDMLTVSLAQLQKKTRTRSHNADIGGKDYILLSNPLESYAHRSERYGGVTADWVAGWLEFVEEIPDDKHHGRAVEPGETKQRDAEYLREKQRIIQLHRRVYYNDDGIRGAIPLLGFCESYFGSTREIFSLAEDERLRVGGQVIDHQGNVVTTGQREYLSALDLYETAEGGWEAMLEMTFQDLPENLTYEQIMEEVTAGGKGGLLNQWFSAAGRAKMFPGRHLKDCLAPLALDLIYRLFQHYKGKGKTAKLRLFDAVMKALDDSMSGGLKIYKAELETVKNALVGPYHRRMSRNLQEWDGGQRQEQLRAYLDVWFKEEYGMDPPASTAGYGVTWGSPEKKRYFRILRGEEAVPRPFTRTGDMTQPDENK